MSWIGQKHASFFFEIGTVQLSDQARKETVQGKIKRLTAGHAGSLWGESVIRKETRINLGDGAGG
jgi:hypothetical protein